MILFYACCNISVLPVRKEPSHRSEMVTQLLFGEKAEVLELNDRDWARIRIEWDGYEGWCKVAQLSMVSKKEYIRGAKFFAGKNTDRLILEEGEIWLPSGAEISGTKTSWCRKPARYKGKKLEIKKLSISGETVKDAAFHYLNAPYLWGGRSTAGIDCSGLMQMAFKLCNYKLPRDASQQAQEGEMVDFLQHAQCGDLAFFDNEEGHINHVGLLLGDNQIIHATDTSGRVVVDKIDGSGIISTFLKKRTHNLRLVKRFF